MEARQRWFPPATQAEADAEWAALDRRYAEPTVAALGDLQGMYTKYGQVCAGQMLNEL